MGILVLGILAFANTSPGDIAGSVSLSRSDAKNNTFNVAGTGSTSIQASAVCSPTASECAINPVDGCNVTKQDFILNKNYNFPNGIAICANNRVVDCQGKSIIGTGIGNGVRNVDYDGVTIRNCTVSGYGAGIALGNWSAGASPIYANTVTGNILTGNADGLNIRMVWTTKITGNTMSNNTSNGLQDIYGRLNTIQGNTITDNSGLGFEGNPENTLLADNQILRNGGGIATNGKNNQILRNTISNNKGGGIAIISERGTAIRNNAISNNLHGLSITTKSNGNNTIEGNTLNNNTQYGVYLYGTGNINSPNIIRSNLVCYNKILDFNLELATGSGDLNTCSKPDGWNDTGTTGCTNKCQSLSVNWGGYKAICGPDKSIEIDWSTTSEINTVGFFVTWSHSKTGSYSTASPFIYSMGEGSQYSWSDTNKDGSPMTPKAGIYNWYKVQEMTTNGEGSVTEAFTTDHICSDTLLTCGGIIGKSCPLNYMCVCPKGGTTNDEFCTCKPK